MVDIRDIQRELSGRPAYDETDRPKWKPKPPRPDNQPRSSKSGQYVSKAPAKVAAEWASVVAENFMEQALAQGMEPPYNANFLANEIVTKVWSEPKFRALQEVGRENDVYRWVAEMVAAFWKTDREDGFTYVRAGDTAGRIRDIFLVDVWDDLRDVAFDTLRARYLKEHGRAKPMKIYERQDTTEMHLALRKVAQDEHYAQELREREEARELRRLDEDTRAVLSSAVEKRRNS